MIKTKNSVIMQTARKIKKIYIKYINIEFNVWYKIIKGLNSNIL